MKKLNTALICAYCQVRPVRGRPCDNRNDCKECHKEYGRILYNFGTLLIYWSYRNSLERK